MQPLLRPRVFIVAALLSFLFINTARAAPGDLDTTFGNGGIVTTALSLFQDEAHAARG